MSLEEKKKKYLKEKEKFLSSFEKLEKEIYRKIEKEEELSKKDKKNLETSTMSLESFWFPDDKKFYKETKRRIENIYIEYFLNVPPVKQH